NIAREVRVERAQPRAGRERLRDVDVGDLPERVNAGVGPASPVDARVRSLNERNGRLDPALNGWHPRLRLPAVVLGAVVLDGQLEPHVGEQFSEGEQV